MLLRVHFARCYSFTSKCVLLRELHIWGNGFTINGWSLKGADVTCHSAFAVDSAVLLNIFLLSGFTHFIALQILRKEASMGQGSFCLALKK